MKKIMGHLTGKLSLSILTVIVLLVGVLAGVNGITSMKASGKSRAAASRSSQNDLASATQASSKAPASSQAPAAGKVSTAPSRASAVPAATNATATKASVSPAVSEKPMDKESAARLLSQSPLAFEPNRGQTDSRVQFLARSLGYQVFLTGPSSAEMQFVHGKTPNHPDILSLNFAGGNSKAAAQLLEPTGGVSNYYIGPDRSKWVEGVPNYSKVRYDDVYPGIDVIYQGDHTRFRYDFLVQPGADPKSIRIAYQGDKGISIDKDGNAVVDLTYGHLVSSKPVVFQEYGGQKHAVDGSYVLTAGNQLAFEIGPYDKTQTLVIDPSNSYASYVGPDAASKNPSPLTATLSTQLNGIALDNIGDIFMTGTTLSPTYGGTPVAPDTTFIGQCAIMVKASLSLVAVASPANTTFCGLSASNNAAGNAIAVEAGSGGTVVVAVGVTNAGTNWPVSHPIAAEPAANENYHTFVVQMTNSLGVTWNTLLVGSGAEIGTGVAVESATSPHPGRVHVVGGTSSDVGTGGNSFLVNTGFSGQPFQGFQASSSAAALGFASTNAFYVALAPGTAPTVAFATYFGGYGTDIANAVAVDTLGNAYMTGTSNSFGAGTVVGVTGFPTGGPACPVNPTVTFPAPIPPNTDFLWTPVQATGTAIVNLGVVTGLTITNPGAGYSHSQNGAAITIEGCPAAHLHMVLQEVTTGAPPTLVTQSANNLPIPTTTLTLTNPGTGYFAGSPAVTISGGGCTVEPTAEASVDTFSPLGALNTLVLTSMGEGCLSGPSAGFTVTIAAPPTVGGLQGIQAQATFSWGTNNITLNPNGTTLPNQHAYVAKFNPNAPPAATPFLQTQGVLTVATNPATLSYAIVLGGSGPVGIPTPPFVSYNSETDVGSAIAVDGFGNAYVAGTTVQPANIGPPLPIPAAAGTFPLVPNPGFVPISSATPGLYGNPNNIIFTSPGTSAGLVTGLTLTSAGIGYPATTTIPVTFFFPFDVTGLNPIGACSVLPTAHAITDTDGSIDVNGLVLDTPGEGCTTAPNVEFLAPHTVPATAFATLGTVVVGNCTGAFEVCGFVVEIVSNQIISGGPITTTTQNGLLLGEPLTSTLLTPPNFVAGFPALVYATAIAGDEACTHCGPTSTFPPTVAISFGNGLGTVPALSETVVGGVYCFGFGLGPTGGCVDPALPFAAPPNGVPMVDGESLGNAITLDTLGNAYVSGQTTITNFVLAEVIGNESVLMRRRVNARGFPTDPTTQTGGVASPTAKNTLFLADFPPQLDHSGNATVTPFGSIPQGPFGTGANNGALSAAAFDPATNSACFDGWVDSGLPSDLTASGTATSIFPNGTGTQPETKFQAYGLTPGITTGFAVCTQFLNDIVVGPVSQPGQSSGITFSLPAGTTYTLATGGLNSTFTMNQANIVATIPPGIPPSATVSFGPVGKVYYDGFHSGPPHSSSTGAAIDWLDVNVIAGTTIGLTLNCAAPGVVGCTDPFPGASFLDPGTYYCALTLIPTVTGGVADNEGIPQTIIITLNVLGVLDVNTAAGGGNKAVGTTSGSTGGTFITAALSQGTAGTAHWVTPAGQAVAPVLDSAGNLVLNIPVISAVPLNSPSNAAFVFTVWQSVCPQGVSPGANINGCMQPFNPPGATPGSTALSILNTGAASGAPVFIGATAGSIFLNPGAGLVEQSPGIFTNDLLWLVDEFGNGLTPCGAPGSFLPFGTFDFTSKAEATDTTCYIQVVIPPTILQGAPTGQPYTATFQLQALPDLSNPVTPLASNPSEAFVSPATESFSLALPTGCAFGVSPTGLCAASVATATVNITVGTQAGPLIINSPWISNTNLPLGCLSGGPGFTTPVCNTNGPTIPIAPFTVPGQVPAGTGIPAACVTATCFSGIVTSAITGGFLAGNNLLNNPFNDVVLDSRNLGTTAPTTFSATVMPGINQVNLAGPSVSVTPLQVSNDLDVFSNISDRLDDRDIPTCTTASPAIPAGVLTVNGSSAFPVTGVLPAANANTTTTAFTIGISNPAAAAMANGFYASTINVVPSGDNGNQGASIPVCLEVGNNIVPQFATIIPPTVVPPPFAGAPGFFGIGANVIPSPPCVPSTIVSPPGTPPSCTVSPGLFIEAGNIQDVQVIASTLGPNQFAPLSGGPSFGTPGYLNIPVDIVSGPGNQTWETPFIAPANIGNEFSASALGSITLGTFTAANCSAGPAGIGSPTGPCFTSAYRDEVVAPPASTPAGQYPLTFTITATGDGLLAATGPVDAPPTPTFTAVLNVGVSNGPALEYTAATSNQTCVPNATIPGIFSCFPETPAFVPTTPGVVAFFTILNGGTGYTAAPTVTVTGGGCAPEPIATANISNPGPLGFVSTIVLNTLGANCTSPPNVTITPPQTAGGIVANAVAVISNGVIPFSFTQQTDTPPASSNPLFTVVRALVSAPGTAVNALGPIFFNPIVPFAPWLSVAHNNCNPIVPNPDPAHVCQFTFALTASVATLPVGNYQALVDLVANPLSTQPSVEAVVVNLTITNLPTVLSTVSTTAGAMFTGAAGSPNTSPSHVTTSLSLNGPPPVGGTVPFTATVSQINGPPNWLFINGGTAAVTGNLPGPSGTPVALTITINPATLTGLTAAVTWDGTVQIATSGTLTSNPLVSIPVSIAISLPSSLQFSPPGPFTTAFTIGQASAATTSFTTQLQQFGTTGTVNFTSSCGVSPCPYITLSPTSTSAGLQTLTIGIVSASLPTTPGPASATITATGAAPSSTTSATVTIAVAAPPVINLPALTCTPANPVTAGTASVTCTTTAALSLAPANPTTLPATVTATIGSGPCTVTPGSSTITLSTTPTPLSFTVGPTTGTGLSATCTVSASVATTGGITPAITAATSAATITVNAATLTASPTSQVVNLPTAAAPATFMETIQAISTGGNNVAVPFNCNPSVALPAGGGWLACTGGTTTTAPPFATSTGTVTIGALGQGQYGGSVAFSSTQLGVTSSPPNVPVTLNVGALAVSGGPITFFHELGVTSPLPSTLNVSAGPAAINWGTSLSGDCAWLTSADGGSITPSSGATIGNALVPVNLSYTAAGAAAEGVGSHACAISFAPVGYGAAAAAANTVTVTVALSVSTNPVWVVTPNASQTVTSVIPSTTLLPTTFQIAASSILAPATTITATVTPNANNPYATIGATTPTPVFTASATTLAVPASPGSIGLTITANPAGLPPGNYQGNFTVTSPSITTAAVVTVNLVVVEQCQFTLTPASPVNLTNAVPVSGTPVTVAGSFTVSPNPGCSSSVGSWTASVSYVGAPPVVSWLIITSGGTGTGSGPVTGGFNALSNPTTSGRTATITITPSVGTVSVLQVTQTASSAPQLNRQVAALYQSVLGRDADPDGFAFWTGAGTAGLGQMLDSFTTSPEAFNTDFAVMSAWQAATGAPPTYAEFISSVLSVRLGGQTIASLFTTLSNANNPGGYTATTLYANLLNRAPTPADASCYAASLAACFETIIGYQATIAPVSATNNEFQSTGTFANHTGSCANGLCTVPGDHTNALYIRMLYYTILGRDADQSGLTFWLGIANSGGAGLLFQGAAGYPTRIQIVGTGVQNQGFAGSAEFQSLYQ